MVVNFTGLPAAFAEISFGMIRPRDASAVYAHPRPQLVRLEERGRLHRVATGYYAVVPTAEDGAHWLPTLEATGYGIAASDYGPDHAVLMGLSAARLHAAVPRALAVAVVATPKQRPPIHLADRRAQIVFVRRDLDRLDAVRRRTDLGSALVTGVEQTVLDLAHRPGLGGVEDEARAAVSALLPRCDPGELIRLATATRRLASMRRAYEWTGSGA